MSEDIPWTWRVLDADGNVVSFGTEPIEITGLAFGEE